MILSLVTLKHFEEAEACMCLPETWLPVIMQGSWVPAEALVEAGGVNEVVLKSIRCLRS